MCFFIDFFLMRVITSPCICNRNCLKKSLLKPIPVLKFHNLAVNIHALYFRTILCRYLRKKCPLYVTARITKCVIYCSGVTLKFKHISAIHFPSYFNADKLQQGFHRPLYLSVWPLVLRAKPFSRILRETVHFKTAPVLMAAAFRCGDIWSLVLPQGPRMAGNVRC